MRTHVWRFAPVEASIEEKKEDNGLTTLRLIEDNVLKEEAGIKIAEWRLETPKKEVEIIDK